jgi:predicted metal-dependent hydrolase
MYMPQITFGSEVFEYEVIRKKRKTISIQITPEGMVKVSSPFGVDDKAIQDILYKKASWIISNLKSIKEVNKTSKEKHYVSGELIQFLGNNYRLEVYEDKSLKGIKVSLAENHFEVRINPDIYEDKREIFVKGALEEWLKQKARIIFEERTRYYCEKLNLKYNVIRIKEQKTLWGSCSSKGNLNYNWRLVMAPPSVLDYLVVHEVCHLKHRDHSKRYWDFVECVMPDYVDKRKWLKENGRKLVL